MEHPFGTIKRWFGYTYFLLKGLENVRAEWTLMTLCYNLKRVLNLVSFTQLMAVVKESAAQPALKRRAASFFGASPSRPPGRLG